MGPKGKGNKSGKPAKLTKADKDRIKQEEADRKAEEEEAARLKEEEEANEQAEKERLQNEERLRLDEQNSIRSKVEFEELQSILTGNRETLAQVALKNKTQEKWNRYMLCDGRPDPLTKKEVNTFINLLTEDVKLNDVGKVLDKAQLILELIEEVQRQIISIKEEEAEPDDVMLASYEESIADFYSVIFTKINFATFSLLKEPGNSVDPDSQNIVNITQSPSITACLWGNSAKNPRVKSVDFDKLSFSLELPKQLTLADVAARVLFTRFDHFSPQSATSRRRVKPPQDDLVPPVQITVADTPPGDDAEGEPVEAVEGNADTLKLSSAASMRSTASAKRIKSAMLMSAISGAASVKGDDETAAGDGEELPANGTSMEEEVPLTAATEDDYVLDDDVVDLRNFVVVGNIMHIELLELPPQARTVGSWTMQQVVSVQLKQFPYATAMSGSLTDGKASSAAISAEPSTFVPPNTSDPSNPDSAVVPASLDATTPLAVKFRCPDNVLVFEPPLVAFWDDNGKNWRLDDVADFQYDEETKMIQMKITKFGPYALIQDMYLNMPFQSYELYPVGVNHCFLTIGAAYMEITVEIKGELCCLCAPEETPQLAHIFRKWMTPDKFVEVMRPSGINVFPQEDGHKYVSVTSKDATLISGLYDQLALTSSAFAYSWSKWNSECGAESAVFQACECLTEDRPSEDAYVLYLATTRLSCRLQMEEFSDQFSDEPAQNTGRHPEIYHTLLDGASEQAISRCQESSVGYTHTVSKLLQACNMLVYS